MPPRELSEEEKQQILLSEDFQRFFDRSTRIVERALYEDGDIFKDYSGVGEEEAEGYVNWEEKELLCTCWYKELSSRFACIPVLVYIS